ncbi:hypothetical protein ACIGXM_29895 [Kitasatospora sp. NPDC052896]|uniref:hypothetical protein n=1 Tax=Kitasatospora sp. NPDC052896 TaxID=3364061 RepID=UPI0037CAD9E0
MPKRSSRSRGCEDGGAALLLCAGTVRALPRALRCGAAPVTVCGVIGAALVAGGTVVALVRALGLRRAQGTAWFRPEGPR